jgi:two-component system, chemotaxis family, CheB/CheR fusion protein
MARNKTNRKNGADPAADQAEMPAPHPDSAEESPVSAANPADDVAERESGFPIVGIGASAGGLAAFEAFFANMPADTESGMAFVLVQHLDPGHKSMLTELVRRYTKMQVFEVTDGMQVEPNCTYIIPPNKDMALMRGHLHLMEPVLPRGLRLPIDFFFRSLAQDRAEAAICIVLSGTGTDGTLGLRAIKEAGGMAMAQAPTTAGYDGMPRSAIATGLSDYVLPPGEMPAQLIAFAQLAYSKKHRRMAGLPASELSNIQHILVLLRSHSGHDFSLYKQNTILRRVKRRMAVNQIERVEKYVQYLRQNTAEMDMLFRELLIGVTSFFRDPQAYEALQDNVIPSLFTEKEGERTVRVWVPGCSTGEEAYSIAMLLQEYVDKIGQPYTLQIFATDIDRESVESARAGIYPASIAIDVAPERLARFFTAQEDTYRVKKSVRDLVIFAEQDVTRDPPFSKIDLLSCRNMLIYFETDLQRKVLPLFHYALRQGGFLFLGTSESTGDFPGLFEAVDRKWKLYRRKSSPSQANLAEFQVPQRLVERTGLHQTSERMDKKPNVRELTEKLLLHDYAPACVLVNERGDILYVFGHTGKYLELPTGEINNNILFSARQGLRLELASALHKVANHGQMARYDGLHVKINGGSQDVNLIVKPAEAGTALEGGLILVIFEDVAPGPAPLPSEEANSLGTLEAERDLQIAGLERELRSKEEYLQTTIEELETANEELKSTNEELQSTNEELQSTNEELETSKEELQSVNEELVTVNNELQQKIDSLSHANNDMNNLLAGTGIGTVFVDDHLKIKRFTPAVTHIINLIPSDIGRPLTHIMLNLVNYMNLEEDIRSVLNDLTHREMEVQAKNGQWYLMRILPYRTLENAIDGAVITFVDISVLKQLRATLQDNQERVRSLEETASEITWSVDANLRLITFNTAFGEDMRKRFGREVGLGQLMPPDWLPQRVQEEWKERYMRGLLGETFLEEITLSTMTGKGGRESPVRQYIIRPLLAANQKVIGVACSSRDISL